MIGGASVVHPPPHLRPTWAEINLDNISHNLEQYRRALGSQVNIMAVVKADGYGHGAVEVARTALNAGASQLAVAFLEEGIELRRAGIQAPILLLGYTDPALASSLYEYSLTPTVFDLEVARGLSRWAADRGHTLPVHIKVDTGMGRIGVLAPEALDFITAVSRLPGLRLEGLLTHLAAADEEDDGGYTHRQIRVFAELVEACREKGIRFSYYHAANSAAAIMHPDARFNLVRIGLSLYGYYPAPWLAAGPVKLRPALSFKSRIIFIKEVPPGTAISYGCTYRTRTRSLIATVPVGYGDGYSRSLSNRGQVLVRGRRAPVVGRVCMDHLMIDVSGIEGVQRGDEVVLYGRQAEEAIPVEEVAGLLGTISYELICSLDKRVPRLYIQGGRLAALRDLLGEEIFTG